MASFFVKKIQLGPVQTSYEGRGRHFGYVSMFHQGYGYSALNSTRSALSNILNKYAGVPFGQHPVVTRVTRGMFRRRHLLSRYQSTWDVWLVLEMFREWSSNKFLSLKALSLKLIILMLLSSCQRVQTVSKFKVNDLFWSSDKSVATFRMSELLKRSRRGTLGLMSFKKWDEELKLCMVRTLKAYLVRTARHRKGENSLFLSF